MALFMYVTVSGEDRIAIFSMDPETGKLAHRGDVPAPGRPAPLVVHPTRQLLYVARRGANEISSYRIDPATGGLSLIGTVGLESDPCYIATDRKGRFLLSAYYAAGGFSVHPIGDNGAVQGPPVQWTQTAKGAHCIQTDPSNRFAFVPHIAAPDGGNMVLQLRFDENTGRLTPNTPPKVVPERPDGPRHFCFHPSLDVLYFSNEQGCSVTAYRLDRSRGTLSPFQTVSTLPEGYKGENTCSQIRMAPSGRFLYAPNRGHNSIACFSVDASGRLTSLGQTPTERVPRVFNIDPQGKFLYAAGLESGRMASYRIDPRTGRLAPLDVYEVGKAPMWVLILSL